MSTCTYAPPPPLPPLIDSLFREFAQLRTKIIGQSFHYWRKETWDERKFGITNESQLDQKSRI